MKKHGEKFLQVTVKTDNIPAIKVYEKNGFKNVGTCMESSGESYIMEISISPEKE
jgi:ribosomal protein S18 acetylase RimI-like enzyme